MRTFVSRVMSLLLNMLPRFIIAFLPRSKCHLISVTVCSDFGAQENIICHCFHFLPIYWPWSDGIRYHDLSFLKKKTLGFPGGSVVKNPPASAGNMELILGLVRFFMPWDNWACAPKLKPLPRAHSQKQETPPQWEACTPQVESSLHSPQLQKSPRAARKTQCSQE